MFPSDFSIHKILKLSLKEKRELTTNCHQYILHVSFFAWKKNIFSQSAIRSIILDEYTINPNKLVVEHKILNNDFFLQINIPQEPLKWHKE